MFLRSREIRHTRIATLREMIERGRTMVELKHYCVHNLKVSTITANNYIKEAAAPYRKKYAEENPENET